VFFIDRILFIGSPMDYGTHSAPELSLAIPFRPTESLPEGLVFAFLLPTDLPFFTKLNLFKSL
jgi:hypothetical protein